MRESLRFESTAALVTESVKSVVKELDIFEHRRGPIQRGFLAAASEIHKHGFRRMLLESANRKHRITQTFSFGHDVVSNNSVVSHTDPYPKSCAISFR
jgi:hypothetical protein